MFFAFMRHARPAFFAATSLSGILACGSRSTDADDMRDTGTAVAMTADSAAAMSGAIPAAGSATMANSALNDTSVLYLIAAVNRGEVDAGRLASTKATQADVKAYGRMMLQEHAADLATLEQIASNAGIALDTGVAPRAPGDVPSANGSSTPAGAVVQLEQNLQQTISQLRVATGTTFDRQYLAAQLAGHRQVLDLLRANEPRLQNPTIRQHATAMAVAVEKHLARARELQTKMSADSTGAATAR